ncbi:hypothetical protein F5884DRAFT_179676 [Xylogone sp. PMI_703]|nr:hypothetical protein F5884DRAFT_179676 [Xylogone sp. PMI_703]
MKTNLNIAQGDRKVEQGPEIHKGKKIPRDPDDGDIQSNTRTENATEQQKEPAARTTTSSTQMAGRSDKKEISQRENYSLAIDMLNDPPLIQGPSYYSDDPYEIPLLKESLRTINETFDSSAVDFYRPKDDKKGRVDLLRRTRPINTIIYDKGPNKVMEQARDTLKHISVHAAKQRAFSGDDLLFRWIHLPANNVSSILLNYI